MTVLIRPARLPDADAVLALRNDPAAVQWSPSGEPVSVEEHARWFPQAVRESPLFYVAAARWDVVGFVRVDVLAWVSIAVATRYRQRGIGRELLETAWAISPGDLRAQVHEENHASLYLFRRTGFTELHRDAPWVFFERTREV